MPSLSENLALEKIAWIATATDTYIVSHPSGSVRSPIRDLIEAVYRLESLPSADSLPAVSHARAILRERIHANYNASISDRETVKVAAKRLSAPSEGSGPGESPGSQTHRLAAPPLPAFKMNPPLAETIPLFPKTISSEDIPFWLGHLKKQTQTAREKWTSDRPVSAILVDGEGQVLAYTWNTNAVIRTRHAEWNLCEFLLAQGRKIPIGATLYVSLKPCRMCAARIWETAEDPSKLNVISLENDPGPLAQGTMLEARSAARVRYLGLAHPLFAIEVSKLTSA